MQLGSCLGLCLLLAACSEASLGDAAYFAAGHESGDLIEWTTSSTWSTGGPYTVSGGSVDVSSEVAHSGSYDARLAVPGTSGALEHAGLGRYGTLPDGGYYGAWLYFPERYAIPPGMWVIFQLNAGTLWDLHLTNRADGEMVLSLWQTPSGSPSTSELGAELPSIPAQRWFHLEVYWKRAWPPTVTSRSGKTTYASTSTPT
jgi:hypothetical protein